MRQGLVDFRVCWRVTNTFPLTPLRIFSAIGVELFQNLGVNLEGEWLRCRALLYGDPLPYGVTNAGVIRNSRSRLNATDNHLHSLRTFASPRVKNERAP
jgi:hypothetical protein